MLRIAWGKICIIFLISSCSILGVNKEEIQEFEYITPIQTYGIKTLSQSSNLPITKNQSDFITEAADSLLNLQPPTVTNKDKPSPAGSYNDYVSKAPYWWPNPNTKDGLPYIRKDGEVNPQTNKMDDQRLNRFTTHLRLITIAYQITNNEKYTKKAIEMLQVWFIDDQTKMEPHLKYAQGIPGRNHGRPYGIIEGRKLIYILDTFSSLESSKHWNKNIEHNLYQWFKNYNDWLWESGMGKYERKSSNNHGSWYDFQIAFISNALGNHSRLREVLNNVYNRIDAQIDKSGRQHKELDRENGLQYSVFNLIPLTYLAELGRNLNYNLWEDNLTLNNYYYPAKNSKLLSAIDYVIPYIFEKDQWTLQQVIEFNECQMAPVLFSAYEYTGDDQYLQLYNNLIESKCVWKNMLHY